jgi:hypothetical protein
MKKAIFLTFSILFIVVELTGQIKVANYSIGKPGTDKYEHFDFWTKDGKPTDIHYAYGKERKEVVIQHLGMDTLNNSRCFKVKFNNNYILYIIPRGRQLQVTDAECKYNKTFSWEYEGPVNGIGMFCEVCAENDEDAMDLIQSMYFK